MVKGKFSWRKSNLFIQGSDGSVGKESACNAGDLGLIPGLGRFTTHSSILGLPWRLSCKEFACNTGSLGWEDPLETGKATPSSILAWRIPWTV